MKARHVFYGFIVIIVLAVCVLFTIASRWSQELQDEMDAWVAAGGVTSVEELVGQSKGLQADTNAVFDYHAAIQLLPDELPAALIDPASTDADELASELQAYTRILQLIDRGVAKECDWLVTDVDLSGFERTGQMRNLVRICIADAYRLSSEGNGEDAVQRLQSGLIIARHVSEYPNVLSPMMCAACEQAIHAAVRDLYETQLETPVRTVQLARSMDDVDFRAMTRHALLGEGAFGCALLEGSQPKFRFNRIPVVANWHDRGQAAYLRYLRELVEYVDAHEMSEMGTARTPAPDRNWTAQQVAPALDLFIRNMIEAATRNALCSAALRARAFKAVRGTYPTVEQFPAMPLDPFTGEPIEYTVDGDGMTLRSAGTDRDGNALEWSWTH